MKLFRYSVSILAGGALLMFAFQNCTFKSAAPLASSSKSVSPDLGANGTGNGAGYDGKTYVTLALNNECPANTQIKSSLLVQPDNRAFITQENCLPVSPPREVTSLLVPLVPHPLFESQILSGQGNSRIFDYLADPVTDILNFQYTVLRCQKFISGSQNIAVAVTRKAIAAGFTGSAYYQAPGPVFTAVPTNNDAVAQIVTGITLSYGSLNPLWRVDLDLLSVDRNDSSHFKGTFTHGSTTGPVTISGLDCWLTPD